MALGQEEKVARRYAKALFEACDPAQFDVAAQQLSVLSAAWSKSVDFRECNLNPRITHEQRAQVLSAVVGALGGWKSDQVKRLVEILVSLRKASIFPRLREMFDALVREYRRHLAMEVTSAQVLSNEEAESMRTRLSAGLGGEVTLSVKCDPALLGGMTIRLGDRYLDRSVAGTLRRVAEQLAK